MSQSERRHNRSANTTRALGFQLGASLRRADLTGMILADEEGVCLATAGDDHACDEIAAHLPMMGRKVDKFEGVLFGPEAQWNIHMKRFTVEGINLYLCAIGDGEARNDQLDHSMMGVTRILMPA
tara:strand:+ start:28520 stop:28894 length:375 start_codon:yes stop_codon:yes gene_type:complete